MDMILDFFHFCYRYIARPIIFRFDSERVHNLITDFGNFFGKHRWIRVFLTRLVAVFDPALQTSVGGVILQNPIGLSAGFDYNARLTQIIPVVGFGFGTVGTVTHHPYEGNELPRLGRLIRSRSLMVNKGFKSAGVHKVVTSLRGLHFKIPIGMSVGRTNTREDMTLERAIEDIATTIQYIEMSQVLLQYYEINISCPNLHSDISFYHPVNLDRLLARIFSLFPSRPIWIKMPIEKSDDVVRGMLDVIVKYPVKAVIFGNLQKNRAEPTLIPAELARYPKGNFSGKPTERRSNELIKLAYQNYGNKIAIVGCGGVFCAEDAYRKIRLGASAVQLITGLIFEGPQLPAEINRGLIAFLRKDGFAHIADAVGKDML